MKKIEFQYPQRFSVVSKTFSNTLVVWFCNSGSFILFEQPAAEVFEMLQSRMKIERIIYYCESKYNFSDARATKFVLEIVERSNFYNTESRTKNTSLPDSYNTEKRKIFTNINYEIGNYIVGIGYGNQLLFNTIHPLFAHLETRDKVVTNDFLELSECNKNLLLNCNEEPVEYFRNNESEFFKGAVLKKLYSLIHRIPDENLMTTLHASGIIKENEAILFVADSGGGKSTLAALFVAKGYKLLSDDFVVFDTGALVYPFPAAISVKNAATETLSEYFPELNNNSGKINSSNNIVRYIPNFYCQIQISYKIKAIVFLNYKKTERFACRKISKKKALPQFLKQCWISPKSEKVDIFLNWFAGTTFYSLVYSKFEDANRAIMKIFSS